MDLKKVAPVPCAYAPPREGLNREPRERLGVKDPFYFPWFESGPYTLGKKSLGRLKGVDPYLVKIVTRAIAITKADFTVLEGVRSRERQKLLFDRGKSRTLNSRHLTGHAVDLVPWVDGKAKWDWEGCYKIAAAMALAELELGGQEGVGGRALLRWGGVWDTRLAILLDTPEPSHPVETIRREYFRYRLRSPKALADGVHFEIQAKESGPSVDSD